ncbi:M20/M25/M40 family metallo-hydrolase [Patulibacter sp.]|uniref:M20/M25/M40 family metallo-hydrolase n=1 Tax=Patulibacter sp. TaxID=1912859 RepID=UPI002722CEEE|nr:M20/M25/M40 family metallo-hydrolase [Patulibacter sp.]MDO9406906.1 M20/M25/M40 family metallo-hydrolase [Patulibacter sp.]
MPRRRSAPDSALDELVGLTLELAAIPAPTGDEQERGDAVARLFSTAGLAVERDAVGNVVGRLPGDDREAPSVVVSAHLDTVFGPEVVLRPRREGDRLLAPGIGDNTVAVAAIVVLARELAAGTLAPGGVVLAATVGEEGLGDLRGAKHLLRTVPARAYVSLEGHLLDELVVGGIGSVRLRASYSGPGGHSWGDRDAPSAVHAMLQAGAAALRAVPAGRHANFGVASGGTTVNAIANTAELLIDLRDEDEARLDATTRIVVEALGVAPRGITAQIDRIGHRPAGRMSSEDGLVRAARAARADVGLRPGREDVGSTECNAAFPVGVPTVCVGLTRGADMHRESEWIAIGPLADGMAVVRALLRRLTA